MTQVYTFCTNYNYHAHRLKHHSKSFIAVGNGGTTGNSCNIICKSHKYTLAKTCDFLHV